MGIRYIITMITRYGLIILLTGLTSACQVGLFAAATPTPLPTNTPLPTRTFTPRPSATPPPTSTSPPTSTPTLTPAAVGEVIIGNKIEYTVVDAIIRERIYPGGSNLYKPNPGYLLIDMGVRIKNLTPGNIVSIPWNQIYVIEDNGDTWYPLWGSTKIVESGETYDPYLIGISYVNVDGGVLIRIENDIYLRMIYVIRDSNQQILFGIGASPKVVITLQK